MKKLLLFLSLFTVVGIQSADAAESEEWDTEQADIDLSALILETRAALTKALEGNKSDKNLLAANEGWTTLRTLLADPNYETTFREQKNYTYPGLRFEHDIPLEIIANADNPDDITLYEAKKYDKDLNTYFTKVKHGNLPDDAQNEISEMYLNLYKRIHQQGLKLPDPLKDIARVEADLKATNGETAFAERVDQLMQIMRQGSALARDRVYVELYKASKKDDGALAQKIAEYKKAAEERNIDEKDEYNQPIFIAKIQGALASALMPAEMRMEGTPTPKDVLDDPRMIVPEDHVTALQNALSKIRGAFNWLFGGDSPPPIEKEFDDAAADAPKQSHVETSVDADTPLDESFVKFEDDETEPKKLNVKDYSHPEKLKILVTYFIQETKSALQKKCKLHAEGKTDDTNTEQLKKLALRWNNLAKVYRNPNLLKTGTSNLAQKINQDAILQYLHSLSNPEDPKTWTANLFRYQGVAVRHSMEDNFIIKVIEALNGEISIEETNTLLSERQFDLSSREDYPTLVHQLQRIIKTMKAMLPADDAAPEGATAEE